MTAISIQPLSDQPLGAVVHGLSAGRRLTDDDFRVVERALIEHLAIVVPELDEDFDWLIDLGRRFGPLVPHILTQFHHPRTAEMSIITANMDSAESRRSAKPAGAFWHSDLSYCADPSDAILLYATHVPGDGGDTLVANMYLAWEALPDRLKRRIEGRSAIHRFGWNAGDALTEPDPARRAQYPDVEHPLVRVHPRTGRRLLFASPGYTMCVKDMDRAESDALLAEIFEHALDPAFQYRHRWLPRQLVAIDNRACLHCAVADYREPMRKLRMIVGCTERAAAAAPH